MPADAEVLIREARRLRRRRWTIGVLTVVVVVGATAAVATVATRRSHETTTVLRISANAGAASASSGPTLKEPENLAIAPNGSLYIADELRDQILVRSPSGRMQVAVGNGVAGNTGDGANATRAAITAPNALTVAPNGTLYFMSGTEVRAVSPDGIITTVVGGATSNPVPARNGALAADVALGDEDGLAVSPSGVLYLCAFGSPKTNGVFAIENGRLVEVVTLRDLVGVDPLYPDDQDLAPFGIAFDRKGDLFLYTTDPYAVIVREPDGALRYVGLSGRPPPTNPFAASGDALYVAANYGLLRFSPDIERAPRTPAPQTALVTNGFADTSRATSSSTREGSPSLPTATSSPTATCTGRQGTVLERVRSSSRFHHRGRSRFSASGATNSTPLPVDDL